MATSCHVSQAFDAAKGEMDDKERLENEDLRRFLLLLNNYIQALGKQPNTQKDLFNEFGWAWDRYREENNC